MTPPNIPWRLKNIRIRYLVAGAALMGAAIADAVIWHTRISSVPMFAVLPDMTFEFGIGQKNKPWQLPSRGVPAYNLMRQGLVPFGLSAIAVAGDLGESWNVASLA